MTLNCKVQLSGTAMLPGFEGLQGNLQLSYTFLFLSVCQHAYPSVWHSGDRQLFRLSFLRDYFCVKMLILWCNTPQTVTTVALCKFMVFISEISFSYCNLLLWCVCSQLPRYHLSITVSSNMPSFSVDFLFMKTDFPWSRFSIQVFFCSLQTNWYPSLLGNRQIYICESAGPVWFALPNCM